VTESNPAPPLGGYAVSVPLTPAPVEDGEEGVSGFVCSRCGEPMPPLPDELAAVVRSGAPVTLTHEVCPGQDPPKPVGRYFEVRVAVVEITEEPQLFDGDPAVVATEMLSFVAGQRAADLEAAMRPLALLLGEKWMEAEKRSKIADMPDAAPEPT
jgi:hypothetical protein